MAVLALAGAGALAGGSLGWVAAGVNIGAALGWIGGTIIGNALFPEKVRGPELSNLHLSGSSYGNAIPQVWGTMRCGGNVIWQTDLQKNEHTSGGGLSGGPKVTNFTYSASFDVLICKSRGDHALLRIWADSRLIYDARDGTAIKGADLPFVFYDGASDQAADATEESIQGAGNVPAYRGVCRCVFTDWDVSEYGNRIPQLNFEVSSGATAGSLDFLIEYPPWPDEASDRTGAYWPGAVLDEDNQITVHQWQALEDTAQSGNPATRSTKISDIDGNIIDSFDTSVPLSGAWFRQTYYQSNYAPLALRHDWDGGTLHADEWMIDGVAHAGVVPALPGHAPGRSFVLAHIHGLSCDLPDSDDRAVWCIGFYEPSPSFGNIVVLAKYDYAGAVPDLAPSVYYQFGLESLVGTADNFTVVVGADGFVYAAGPKNKDTGASVSPNRYVYKFDRSLSLLASGSGYVYPMTGVLNNPSQSIFSYRPVVCSDGTWICVVRDPTTTNIHYYRHLTLRADLSGWDTLAVGAAIAGEGGYSSVDLGQGLVVSGMGLMRACPSRGGGVLLRDIVAALHDACGHTAANDYNVDELPDPVRGFMLSEVMTGRSAIESLMPLWAFDATQIDGKVTYVKRGHQSIITIPDGDLAAHAGSGADAPDKLETVRGNDTDLPKQIYLKYFNVGADYQIGTQQWHRGGTRSQVVQTVNAAVAFNDAEAKQRADWLGENAWNDRTTYKFTTTRKYLAYTPTDVVTVQGIPIHVRKIGEDMGSGVLTFEGMRSRAGIFATAGIGGEAEGFPDPTVPEPQLTELALLDIPLIVDPSQQGVTWVAAQGADRVDWRGMSLQKSVDGGANYAEVLATTVHDTIGEALTLLPDYGGIRSFDESAVLDVSIHPGGGELVSTTRRSCFTGANLAMIGAEMISFRSAVLQSVDTAGNRTYRTTGLLRGLHGTDWAMRGHAIGDRFVLVPPNSVMNFLHSDLGRTRLYKPVTFGNSIADTPSQDFRCNGIPLQCYAPIDLGAGFVGDPGSSDILLRWRRRSRLFGGWLNIHHPTGQDSMPIGETAEAYRVWIYSDGTRATEKRIIDVTEHDALYTVAQQTADFGSALSVLPTWDVAQIGSLGPGYRAPLGFLPMFVPDDTDGYVPPIVPPVGGVTVMPWTEATTLHSGSFGQTDTWIIQVTTGSIDSGAHGLVRLQGAEFGGPPVLREWTFSATAGDFGPQARPGAQASGTPSITALFVVGSGDDFGGYYPVVPHSTTRYLNIRNLPSSYTDMPMFVTLLNIPV